jgi:hypothetical protein
MARVPLVVSGLVTCGELYILPSTVLSEQACPALLNRVPNAVSTRFPSSIHLHQEHSTLHNGINGALIARTDTTDSKHACSETTG